MKMKKKLLFIMMFSTVLIFGCGLKGGLYLPEEGKSDKVLNSDNDNTAVPAVEKEEASFAGA